MNEIWKDIVGYSGIYDVSDMGRVCSLDRLDAAGHKLKSRILKQTPSGVGYLKVGLCQNGKMQTRQVHQLVCEAFIGPCPEGMEVCHGPNGKLDNSLTNLRYGTRSENSMDKVRDGTHDGIAVVRGDGKEFISQVEAGRESNCHQESISRCCKGKQKTTGGHTWKYKEQNNEN